jgi:hypothetical protein
MLWSCSISQHLRIQPFSHHVLYAFGEWNMGLVKPDWIWSEPIVLGCVHRAFVGEGGRWSQLWRRGLSRDRLSVHVSWRCL